MTRPGADAEDSYRESISQLERCQMVVDLARTHLLYGQWLRRARRRTDARAELHALFAQVGAERFADLAAAEAGRRRGLIRAADSVR